MICIFQCNKYILLSHLLSFTTCPKTSKTLSLILVRIFGLKYLCNKLYKLVNHKCSVGTMLWERWLINLKIELSGRSAAQSSIREKYCLMEPLKLPKSRRFSILFKVSWTFWCIDLFGCRAETSEIRYVTSKLFIFYIFMWFELDLQHSLCSTGIW